MGGPRHFSALVLLVIAGSVAGCGGGSSSTSGSESTLPRADWAKRADAVCEAATPRNEEIRGRLDEASEEATTEDLSSGMSDAIGEAADELRKVAGEIDAIPSPRGHELPASELVDALEGVADNFEELSSDLSDSDESLVEADERQGEEVQATARRLAHRLGLKICGSSA